MGAPSSLAEIRAGLEPASRARCVIGSKLGTAHSITPPKLRAQRAGSRDQSAVFVGIPIVIRQIVPFASFAASSRNTLFIREDQ